MRAHAESYDRIGDVPAWVHDLDRRWQEEEARGRVFVSPEESILTVSVPTSVPPQVAWEFLTTPGQRMTWQPWVTSVTIKGAPGGRRGLGSANHCMHGKDAVVEENPGLAALDLRHRPDHPRHPRRTGEVAPHDRAGAGPRSTSDSPRR